MKILIAYDGSANADHAIDVAAGLFTDAETEIIHAWESFSSAAARSAIYFPTYELSVETMDREEQRAAEVVERGIARAREAGLQVTGNAVRTSGPIWEAIVDRILELEPDLTVMGTRGLTGLRSALAGSTSHAVVCHAHAPVLTVPLERS